MRAASNVAFVLMLVGPLPVAMYVAMRELTRSRDEEVGR